jgi:hypothetical protein
MNRTILLLISFFLVSVNTSAQEENSVGPMVAGVNATAAGNWTESDLVTSSDAAADDRFSYNAFGGSYAVDSDGVRMIVGAIGDDINGFTYAGGAYIFDYVDGAWAENQKLTPPDPATAGESTAFGGYLYGGSVSIDGDIAVVGEPEYNNNGAAFNLGRQGQATVYRYNSMADTWEQASILNAGPEEVFESNFGNSATVDEDGAPGGNERILVGGLGRTSEAGFWTGKAYVFDWDGSKWVMTSLKNPDPTNNDYFGAFSDLDGDTAIIGMGNANGLAGEAWVFEFDGANWGAGISLHGLIPARFAGDRFGTAVAVDGDFAVVGAYDTTTGGDGSAYIFWNNPVGSWELFDTLTDGDGDDGDQFGRFVEIEGNRILITAYTNEIDDTVNAGSVYAYEYNGADWVFKQQINRTPPDGADGFALGATFANEQVIVGAGYDDTFEVNQGGVVVFEPLHDNVFKDGFESSE